MQIMNSLFLHEIWAENLVGRTDVIEKLGTELHSNIYWFIL